MTKPARIISVFVFTLIFAVLSVSPSSRLRQVPTPVLAEPDPPQAEPFICPIDGQPVTEISSSLIGIVGITSTGGNEGFIKASRLMGEAGVYYSRLFVRWDYIETQRNQYDWTRYDWKLEAMKNDGLEPVITILGTPEWASTNPPGDGNYEDYMPQDISDWEDFVREIVRRYGPSGSNLVSNWEIWNEPDVSGTFQGTTEDYIELLNTAYDVIKHEDPSVKVWAPETTAGDFLNRDPSYTKSTIENGKFDVFAIHIFRKMEKSYDITRAVRDYLDSSGLSHIPLYITATNLQGPYTSGVCPYSCTPETQDTCVTEEEQAEELKNRYYCLANAGAESIFWYKVADTEASICPDGVNRNGVLRTDISLKPAYFALKAIGEYLNPPLLPGDADGDGRVDEADLELLKGDYLGQPVHNTDFNSDGRVDCEDFAILQANFLK